MVEKTHDEALEMIEMAALTPVYEEALVEDPDDLAALHFLGHAYTKLGRHEDGLDVDLRFTRLRPEDAVARYNLACSFALLARSDEAIAALRESIRLGYREPDHMAVDPDLDPVRKDPRFTRLLEELRTDAAT